MSNKVENIQERDKIKKYGHLRWLIAKHFLSKPLDQIIANQSETNTFHVRLFARINYLTSSLLFYLNLELSHTIELFLLIIIFLLDLLDLVFALMNNTMNHLNSLRINCAKLLKGF